MYIDTIFQMGQSEGDFEKGEASGSETALSVVSQTARSWRHTQTEPTRTVCVVSMLVTALLTPLQNKILYAILLQ
jgi:hypothetical protein